jgi:hypothetical protein
MIGISSVALLASLPLTISIGGVLTSPREPQVLIVEDWRPTGTWRTFGGTCGKHRYEVSLDVGKRPLASSVLEAKVDEHSHRTAVRDALASQNLSGAIVDATIDRCEANRARIQLDVIQEGKPPNLHPYYLWLGSDGSVELPSRR